MNRFKRLLLLGLLVSSCAWAQQFSSITIGTTAPNQLGDGPGPVFAVDGQQFTSTQVFTWPAGSEHIVQFLLSLDPVTQLPLAYQGTTGDNTRFYFGSWTDSTGLLGPRSNPVQTVTASPTLTSLIASVAVEYRVHVNFQTGNGIDTVVCPTGAGAPGAPGTLPGIIYVNNQCVAGITDFWVGAGPVVLNAFPYPGFVFLGWSINGGPNTYLLTYNLTGPIQITPLWEPAKLVHFITNPGGLSVLVDHSPVSTAGNPLTPVSPLDYGSSCAAGWATLPPAAPAGFVQLCVGDFDFAPGSTHVVGAVSPQQDAQGNYWIFTSYANGLTQNSSYVVDTNTSTAATMQANFIQGMEVSILTNPGGLKVTVDGNPSGIPPYNFVWGTGQTHTVAAPALQTDSNGRQWAFSSWSNKGPATQTITVPAGGGYVVTANFVELGQLNVTSNPTGLTFTVGGSPCTTPCTVNGPSGTQTQVSAPASIPTSSTSRYDFGGWGDGTTNASATVTFNQNVQSVTASYHASYMLAMSADPTGGASFSLAPATPDGYYTDGTAVSITATPKPGFQFRRWDGDLSGTFNTGYLTMSSPHSAIADLNSVPFIPPAGIQTAAGPTPDGSVGVGSLISIYGTNLAPSLVIGPSNPLSQTIGGVTVQIASSTLPLSFVSAGQINAQVPTALPDGNYPLVVHSAGQPDVTGTVTISRDAPALFQNPTPQNLPLAVAVHQDGTPVTLSSPALHGEQVTLYGTGFGPYTLGLPDGFATPATATYAVADPVTITVGGVQKQPDFAGAATGLVGIVLVQFTITSDIPTNAPLDLTVSVNGKISGKVTLPVQ